LLLGVFALALRNGTISDWHVSDRRQRLAPLLVIASVLLTGLPVVLLYLLNGPRYILAAAAAALALVVLNLLITAIWKISQHVSAIALATTLVTASFGPVAAPVLILIPLVAWARVSVGAHTVAQTIAGGATGVVVCALTLRILGIA
jgi:membrane-associated phospholipid phosphatase